MMYEVIAKCGHVGRNQYVLKTIPVIATSGVEAAAMIRELPRVKHDHPDAIREVRIIDAPRYWELTKVYQDDPYFKCRSIQEQRALCGDMELYDEIKDCAPNRETDNQSKKSVFRGKQRIRNPKRYINNYYVSEDYAA